MTIKVAFKIAQKQILTLKHFCKENLPILVHIHTGKRFRNTGIERKSCTTYLQKDLPEFPEHRAFEVRDGPVDFPVHFGAALVSDPPERVAGTLPPVLGVALGAGGGQEAAADRHRHEERDCSGIWKRQATGHLRNG